MTDKKRLDSSEIDLIVKGIKSIIANKGVCKSPELAFLLMRQYPDKFKVDDWAGFRKFKQMIDSEPDLIIPYYLGSDRTILYIRLADDHTYIKESSESQQRQNQQCLEFSAYVRKYFDAEECKNLRKDIMATFDECLTEDCVLRTKLIYMFRRAEAQNLVSGQKELGLAYHTGLFRNEIDPIYFIWTKRSDGTQTHLLLTGSSREFREMMRTLGNEIPRQPSFERLAFNPDLEIVPEYGHIIKERYYRIPKSIWDMLRNSPDIHEDLREANDEVLAIKSFNYLRRHLIGCIMDTQDRLRNESDDPVRYWHKSSNKMCWLVPLRFGISEQADLALVLEPTIINGQDAYRACTILPMKEAFKAARVVGKVKAEWLKDAWRE